MRKAMGASQGGALLGGMRRKHKRRRSKEAGADFVAVRRARPSVSFRSLSDEPNARTLERLRELGYNVHNVEQTVPKTFIKRDC